MREIKGQFRETRNIALASDRIECGNTEMSAQGRTLANHSFI
jgi:hypothetical protein